MSNSEPVPDPGQTPPPTGRPSRALLIVLALILTLVAVALVVVFTRGQPAALAADTPDGVVQRYASAVLEGDDTAAGAYLSARTLATCDSAAAPGSESTRVTLISAGARAHRRGAGLDHHVDRQHCVRFVGVRVPGCLHPGHGRRRLVD